MTYDPDDKYLLKPPPLRPVPLHGTEEECRRERFWLNLALVGGVVLFALAVLVCVVLA